MSHAIPNWLTLSVGLAFVPVAWLAGLSWGDVTLHLLFGLALIFGSYALAGLDGGTAKLFGAVATWTGLDASFLGFTLVAFGGMSLAFLVLKLIGRPASALPFLPYAAIGFIMALPYTPVWSGLASLTI